MKRKIILVGVIGIFLLFIVGRIFAQSAQDIIDIYDATPENEYYITSFLNGGKLKQYTVPSCAEAVSLKDKIFYENSLVSSVSIRAKYRVHIWHDDCNKIYYR